MGSDGLTWTLETLDAYIDNPKALVSGTRMNYRGLKDAGQRADLLGFLRDWSDRPQNIPEAEPTARPSVPGLDPAVFDIVGDREYGEYLSAECKTCHQADGSDAGIPSINNWPEDDFVAAMQAYKIMHGLWGMGQMMFSKYLVVVDAEVDVHNTSEVLFHLCANTDPQRDSLFTKGPSDVLDHATSEIAVGTKLGMDATRKLPGEGFHRPWPPLIRMDTAVREKIDRLFPSKARG